VTIRNPKIARVWPDRILFRRWDPAGVRGVSLLYDAPGNSYKEHDGCQVLSCDLTNPQVALYAGLARAAEQMEPVLSELRPCWIAPTSYHSTYANSINQFNLHKIESLHHRIQYARFLGRLPNSMVGPLPDGFPPHRVQTDFPWRIRFRFDRLQLWPKDFALVALLEPADEESVSVLAMLSQRRTSVNEELIGLGLPGDTGTIAHVTLCYFASDEEAVLAMERLGHCTNVLPAGLRDLTAEHVSVSLYGWTSMVDFWRISISRMWGCGDSTV